MKKAAEGAGEKATEKAIKPKKAAAAPAEGGQGEEDGADKKKTQR